MALTPENWQRQLADPFASESLAPDGAIALDAANKRMIASIFANVNSSSKLLGRIVIPTRFIKPEGKSWQWQFGAQLLVYPGSAAAYTGSTVPALNTARNASEAPVVWSPAIDLDAFYTAAGDLPS